MLISLYSTLEQINTCTPVFVHLKIFRLGMVMFDWTSHDNASFQIDEISTSVAAFTNNVNMIKDSYSKPRFEAEVTSNDIHAQLLSQ